jgi:hypothetical protein
LYKYRTWTLHAGRGPSLYKIMHVVGTTHAGAGYSSNIAWKILIQILILDVGHLHAKYAKTAWTKLSHRYLAMF